MFSVIQYLALYLVIFIYQGKILSKPKTASYSTYLYYNGSIQIILDPSKIASAAERVQPLCTNKITPRISTSLKSMTHNSPSQASNSIKRPVLSGSFPGFNAAAAHPQRRVSTAAPLRLLDLRPLQLARPPAVRTPSTTSSPATPAHRRLLNTCAGTLLLLLDRF